jgi:23S rRNA (adenine2503-C2)-methyltransferase
MKTDTLKKNIYNCTCKDLETIVLKLGEQSYRAKQIFEWLFQKQVSEFTQMSNLSSKLIEKLKTHFTMQLPKITNIRHDQNDNSYKFLLETTDKKLIESILMLSEKRATLCVSCMIGCPLKCAFCATGSALRYCRKLDTSEIIGQFLVIQSYAKKHNLAQKITNIVFMGMGEPLLNKKQVENTLDILLHTHGCALSRNRITISTAGICDGLSDLINTYRIKLAVSLHFPNDELRTKYMPINKKYPLKNLIDELKKIILAKRDNITVEYIMLNGINDTITHAKQLVKLLHGIKVKINLIPYNPTDHFKVSPSTQTQINNFAKYIRSKSIMVTIRHSKGKKIKGGCGQFVLSKGKK